MELSMVKDLQNGQIGRNIMANGKIIRDREKELKIGVMEQNMKETG